MVDFDFLDLELFVGNFGGDASCMKSTFVYDWDDGSEARHNDLDVVDSDART